MHRRSRIVGLSLALVAVALGPHAALAASTTVDGRIAEAEALFDRWSGPFDFAAYRVRLESAIDLWEAVLPEIPADAIQTRSHVLNRIAQAWFGLAEGYLEGKREREPAYERSRDAALASLRLDPAFVATERSDGFRAALRSADDVAAIFWYGNGLGQWLSYHVFTALMGGVRDVHASFERSLELDETYEGGGPHRAMASFLTRASFLVGRSKDEAVAHFERAIELAPNHLEARVSYAEFYAKPAEDWALFDSLLAETLALADDPLVLAAWPFYNSLSVGRAEALAEARGAAR